MRNRVNFGTLVYVAITLFLSTQSIGQTYLEWPLRQSSSFNDPGYYYISNHVDHDPSANLLDYNGGDRTYNGHDGTDIVASPFWWKKMNECQVEVIAAADGILLGKSDGNFDQSCAQNGGSWNYVLIQHSDGSKAYYGHLKKNSVTSKSIGQEIHVGEYLGCVGSSGNSDKPHLHFELRLSDNTLIDPFFGPDNNTTSTSWWVTQPDYHDSGLNKIVISDQMPEHISQNCPDPEITNEKCTFSPGDAFVISRYYRHAVLNQLSICTIFRPDGSVWDIWNHLQPSTYKRRSSYNERTLPVNAMEGIWSMEVEYLEEKYTKYFNVSSNNISCHCDLVVPEITQVEYQSVNSVTSTASILNNNTVEFIAGNYILLKGGFCVELGSSFKTILDSCNE